MIDHYPRSTGEAQERRPLALTPEMFRLTTVPCPRCLGPMPQFVWERPESAGDYRGLDWGKVGGYARYTNIGASPLRTCRPCSLQAAIATLCGGSVRERIADPATLELEKLRAEVVALNAPKRKPALDSLVDDSLVELGRVYITPAVRSHAKPRGCSPAQWAAVIDGMVNEHRLGRFGLNGEMPIHVTAESRRLGPVASVEQQNGAAIHDGVGSVRSQFFRIADLPSHARRDRGDVIHVWTELSAGSTLVYRPGDAVEID